MTCKNCNHCLLNTPVRAKFVEVLGEGYAINIEIECPKCKYVHYTIVSPTDLII